MPRSRKRDANAVQVTVRPNNEGSKRSATKKNYTSNKKYFKKMSENGQKRSVELTNTFVGTTNLTVNTVATAAIAANDITTIQPMGRDQMFTIYNKCYVKDVSQDMYFRIPYSATSTRAITWIINHWVDNNSGTSATVQESSERCLSHDGKHVVKASYSADSGDDVNSTMEVVHTHIEGGTKRIMNRGFDDPDLTCSAGSGPTSLWYIHYEVYPNEFAGTATFPSTDFERVTKFECIFYDPKELGVS